jgi:exodeoxyribonuclease VII small subunit
MSQTPSFEEAIKKLEEIIEALESDDLPLEKSIALFDEGTKLSKICGQRLTDAQEKIDHLIEAMQEKTSPAS